MPPSVISSLSPPTLQPAVPVAPTLRDFTDPSATRDLVYSRVLDQVRNIGPLSNSLHTLELLNPKYIDTDKISIPDQKQAILTGKSLHRRIKGTWRFKENATNKVLDQQDMTIAQVPHMTPRGTFILNGTEYALANQMRLRPGIFTRIKENGEIESHVNVMPGNGISHRYFLDPETGIFKINIGQAKLPLLPILKAFGVSNTELRKVWGDELLNANLQAPDAKTVSKLYQRLIRKGNPEATDEEKGKSLHDLFTAMKLDPEVTKRTLNNPHTNLTKDAILDTTKKLIAVSRREQGPDDRDHMAFQTLHGPEDLLAERITKDRAFLRQLLWRSSFRGNLSGMHPGVLTRQLHHTLLHTGLANPVEEINSSELLDAQGRATRLGEGGIGSIDAVPDECFDADTEVFTADGWLSWGSVNSKTQFACQINGTMEFHPSRRLIVQDYVGDMYGIKTRTLNHLVTPHHRLWCRPYRGPSSIARCGLADWRFELAILAHNRPREFALTCEAYRGQPSLLSSPPPVDGARVIYDNFALDDWAELLGWYISEGGIDSWALRERSKYHITISQCLSANPQKVERIAALLVRMDIPYCYSGHNFVFTSKQLGTYFENCGVGAINKGLPGEVFTWPVGARRRLLDALVAGDGHIKSNGAITYTSTSQRLVEHVIRLATTLGIPAKERRYHDPINLMHSRVYSCGLLTSKTQGITDARFYDDNYYIQPYDGRVYCAEVPGELLLVRRHGSVPTWSGNSRAVQPSHLGFIDLVRTPESFRVGVDTRIANTARKGSDGRIYAPFIDVKTGKTEYKSPQDIADLTLAFPGEMAKNKPYVAAMQGGVTKMVPRADVNIEMPHFENAFSPLANMIPGKSALKGQRMSMGSRYLAQALPLTQREAPYLQSALPGMHMQKSFEDQYGSHMGAVRALGRGVVKKVTPEGITVQYADGTKHTHELYHNFPFSRKTFLHNEPAVKAGQEVDKDTLLAASNFTDNQGTTALGLNARIAFMAFRGRNYEDAAVMSESMAKRMTSEHMYKHDQEWAPNIKKGLKPFISLFPTEYEKPQLHNMDSHGVVKPGTEVKFGDPLILVAEERERTHSQIHAGRKPSFSNKSLTWEHHSPGIVTDVAHTPKGVTVAVKAHVPMQVGDKLCFDPETEVLTHTGWKRAPDVCMTDKIATLNVETDALEYQYPTKLYNYYHVGEMFVLRSKHLDIKVTAEHRLWVARPNEDYQAVTAEEFDDSTGTWLFKKASSGWKGEEQEWMVFGPPPEGAKFYIPRCKMDDWLEFLGYYIAEGHVAINKASKAKYVRISQSDDSPHLEKITKVLTRLGINYYRASGSSGYFQISSTWLYSVLVEFGNSEGKYVPDYVQNLSPRQLKIFFDAYMDGDGHRGSTWEFSSKSRQLVDDIGVLCLKLGWATNIKSYRRLKPGRPDEIGYRARINKKHLTPWWNQQRAKSYNNYQGWELYSGQVYCVEVPNHVIYTRRNGLPLYTHNSNRWGGKGILSEIVPDDQMPRDENGQPYELALNPLGMISRINPIQIHETILGKIANKTGHPYKLEDFSKIDDLVKFVQQERQKHGIKDVETVIDPETGRRIPNILTGFQYILKLHHTAESKGQGRGIGRYTAEDIPARGGEAGSKKIALLETNALLSHGAPEFLRDAHLVRGQRNDAYWQQFMSGLRPPEPEIPHIYKKFVDSLKGSGINVVREGRQLHIMALTNKDVDKLSGDRELQNANTVDWKEGLKPKRGGLFDPSLTGGHGGNRWAKITLNEPLPNPAFEEPIRRILGLTQKKLDAVIAGAEPFGSHGTGPSAISNALKDINLPSAIREAEAAAHSSTRTARDDALRKLQYLKDAQRIGIHPKDWVLSAVPVIPPIYRHVAVLAGTGSQQVGDANYLYKELFDANQLLSEAKDAGIGDLQQERATAYNALKGVVGLGDPVQPKNQERQVKGLLKHVFGTSPKFGMVQRQLMGATVELVGRAVVSPNPELDMDQVGLPENKAWEVYKPFIIRRLVQHGVPRLEAARAFTEQKPIARDALIKEMAYRPIVMSRAPVLHRYGIIGMLPRLVKGNVLEVPPIVTAGLGMDFDGDTSNYHVPATEEARQEVLEKLLPSRNLLSAANFNVHYLPSHEYQGGLYHATTAKDEKQRPQIFRSKEDAIKAYREGRISLATSIEVVHH